MERCHLIMRLSLPRHLCCANCITSLQVMLASEITSPGWPYVAILSLQRLIFLLQSVTMLMCVVQEISLQSRVGPQGYETSRHTTCAAVLHDPVTKTYSYKVQHVYVEASDKLYRSPGAAEVSNLFPRNPSLRVDEPHVRTITSFGMSQYALPCFCNAFWKTSARDSGACIKVQGQA